MTENTDKELQYLLRQYFNGEITEVEYQELWKLLQADAKENTLSGELQLLWEYASDMKPAIEAKAWSEKMQHLLNETNPVFPGLTSGKKTMRQSYKWYAAAAIAALIAIAGIYFYQATRSSKNNKTAAIHVSVQGIAPGGNKAMLTLANGATVILDSSANGVISRQGNAQIIKNESGKITYNRVSANHANGVYNTISTPRGGQYRVTLSDGTKVWLNSASTLRFPTSFTGNKRRVEMTGEAYFEVKDNATKPFVVSVDGMQVKVLGTHFNIMAYDDETVVKTTLLEGAVSIKKGREKVLLKPDQQAKMDKEGAINVIKDSNVNKAVAWKNNLFWFDKSNIHEVMRVVSRWYNADVVIKGNIPQHFTGSIPKNVNVLKVFQVLQETGNIHFQIDGHKIIVTP